MKQEFISYNQALDLKDLGFDEPCIGYYNYDGSYFFKYKPITDEATLAVALDA